MRVYGEQIEAVQKLGGRVILMASRALADYASVYAKVLAMADKPVILHWLGEMFDPALGGYWAPPASSTRWRARSRS